MNKITLLVKVMSCKGLKAFNFFQKLLVYALVSVLISSDGDNKEEAEEVQQQHRTQRDEEGDGDPEWNQEMQFDVDEGLYRNHSDRLLIHFELRHQGIMFGDKVIGKVRVPLKDLIEDEFSCDGVARFVSYEVRSTDGKPNGVLNFSYKLLLNPHPIPKVQPLPCSSTSSSTSNYSSGSNNVTAGYPTSPRERVQYPSPDQPLEVPPQPVPHSWPTQYGYPPPPPPPVVHWEHNYYPPPPPPPPPQVHYWPPQQHVGPQDTWSSSSGEPHALGKEDIRPTPSGQHHHHHWSTFWNGR